MAMPRQRVVPGPPVLPLFCPPEPLRQQTRWTQQTHISTLIFNIERAAVPLSLPPVGAPPPAVRDTLTTGRRKHRCWWKSLNKDSATPPSVTRECLTCALFQSGAFFHSVTAEFAAEVVFPELCKPDIPSVVLQRSADEVTIKPWTDAGGEEERQRRVAPSLTGTPPTVRA